MPNDATKVTASAVRGEACAVFTVPLELFVLVVAVVSIQLKIFFLTLSRLFIKNL